jgi:hypothetical protein
MTLEDFKLNPPDPGQLLILRDELTNEVKGLTIHRTDCTLSAYDSSLGKLTGLTIDLGEGIIVTVTDSKKYGSYYFLEVVPFEFTETVNEDLCISILLEPFDENTSIEFRNTEFYPLYNNVPETITQATLNNIFQGKLEVRRGKNIYDVDRKNDAIVPTNIINILEGTANLAEFPESNYSCLANTTGRYLGSKTSVEDFGIQSALSIASFEAALYEADTDPQLICSQSYSDRKLTSLGFLKSEGLPSSINTYPDFGIRTNQFLADGEIRSSNPGTVYAKLDATQTQVTIRFNDLKNLAIGDVLSVSRISDSALPYSSGSEPYVVTNYQYIEVKKIVSSTPAGGGYSNYTLNIVRGLTDSSEDIISTSASTPLYIFKLKADTVFQFEKNKLTKATNKLIYLPNTEQIMYLGSTGKIIYNKETCSI